MLLSSVAKSKSHSVHPFSGYILSTALTGGGNLIKYSNESWRGKKWSSTPDDDIIIVNSLWINWIWIDKFQDYRFFGWNFLQRLHDSTGANFTAKKVQIALTRPFSRQTAPATFVYCSMFFNRDMKIRYKYEKKKSISCDCMLTGSIVARHAPLFHTLASNFRTWFQSLQFFFSPMVNEDVFHIFDDFRWLINENNHFWFYEYLSEKQSSCFKINFHLFILISFITYSKPTNQLFHHEFAWKIRDINKYHVITWLRYTVAYMININKWFHYKTEYCEIFDLEKSHFMSFLNYTEKTTLLQKSFHEFYANVFFFIFTTILAAYFETSVKPHANDVIERLEALFSVVSLIVV